MRLKKITAAVLAIAIMTATGCQSKDEKNAELIQTVTTGFFEALVEEDSDRIEGLTGGLEYESSLENLREYLGENYDIFQRFLSYTEVVEMGEVEFDYEHGRARMRTTFSFLDIEGLTGDLEFPYCTHDELMEMLDEYDSCKHKTFTLEYEIDSDSGEWILTKKSAAKVINFIGTKINRFPNIVEVSPVQARQMVEDFLNGLAETGTYDDIMVDLDIDDFRVYENVTERGDGPQTQEALSGFISAYMSYVLDHDYTIEAVSPYYFILTGSAPSDEDLYEQLSAPEFLYEYYQNEMSYIYLNRSHEDEMDAQSAHVYDWLAGAVDLAEPEDYMLSVSISPYSMDGGMITVESSIIPEPYRGLYEAMHSVDWETFEEMMSAAAEGLNASGEMSDILYVEILNGLTPENYGYALSGNGNSSGRPNQAVGTYEQVPSWCEDGSLIYGYSNPDANGYWMFYSKEPGVLDTVGYYLGDGGIWITNYYDREFNAGDILEVDWWIDGDQVVSSDRVFVNEDGTTEIEVFLPFYNVGDFTECEMRLWEEGHNHVISYVTLTYD